MNWVELGSDDQRAGCASLAILSWELGKAEDEGLRADNMSLANLSWEVATEGALVCGGPRADFASQAILSEGWATAEESLLESG